MVNKLDEFVWVLMTGLIIIIALFAMDDVVVRYPLRWRVIHEVSLLVGICLISRQEWLVKRLRLSHVLVGGVTTALLLGGVVYPLVRYGF